MEEQLTLLDQFSIACRSDIDVRFASIFSSAWASELCYSRAKDMLAERSKYKSNATGEPEKTRD